MAITTKEEGVWGLSEVYNKINQGSIWEYTGQQLLFSWGRNTVNGTLGLNDNVDRSSPTQVPGTTWSSVFVPGYAPSSQLAIKTDGTLWSWGYNYIGSLGLNQGGFPRISSPTQVPGTTWKQGAKQFHGACAIKTDGTLWCWGNNTAGTLAQNNRTHRSSPTQVGSGSDWDKICGSYNSFTAIKTDGTMWEWGSTRSQNVDNNDAQRSSPCQIPGSTWSSFGSATGGVTCFRAIKTDGTLWTWGNNYYGILANNAVSNTGVSSPIQIPGSWTTIGGSGTIGYGIKTDGTSWVWGNNTHGTLGLNSRTQYSSPVQIPGTTWNSFYSAAEGSSHEVTIGTKTDGTMWSWGYHDYGQLGLNGPANIMRSSPTQIPGTNWKDSELSYSTKGWISTQSN